MQFQGILTLAELLQGLLGALQLHLQVRQGLLVSADSGGQLFLLRHVLLQFCETLVESFDVLVHLVAVRSGACFQRIVDREAKNISQNTLALPGRRVVNSSARPQHEHRVDERVIVHVQQLDNFCLSLADARPTQGAIALRGLIKALQLQG